MSPTPVLAVAALAGHGRELPARFDLRWPDGLVLACGPLLRVLPGRRLVVHARHHSLGSCVLKLFLGAGAERAAEREIAGLQAVGRAGLAHPGLLDTLQAPDAFGVLLETLEAADDDSAQRWVAVAATLGRLHAAGLGHRDPHRDNFLGRGDTVAVVDGAAIDLQAVGARGEREQLALLLAQLPASLGARDAELVAAWMHGRGLAAAPWSPQALRRAVGRQRRRRVRRYLGKTMRNCSEFRPWRTGGLRLCARREGLDAALVEQLQRPQSLTGTTLKAGRSARVVHGCWVGRELVCKRYLQRDRWRALRRGLRRSRAERAWRIGQLMGLLGLATAAPLALVERRLGPLRLDSWLVTEAVDGTALDALQADALAPMELDALAGLIAALHRAGLTHGDLKASNLLRRGTGDWVLLDLDAARWHPVALLGGRRRRRDWQRLLRHFEGAPAAHRRLQAHARSALGEPSWG